MKILKLLVVGIVFCASLFIMIPHVAFGELNNNSIKLSAGIKSQQKMFDENQLLAPSRVTSSREIEYINMGSSSLKLFQAFEFFLSKKDDVDYDLENILDKYVVKPEFLLNGDPIDIRGLTGQSINAKEFNEFFEVEKGKETIELNPTDVLTVKLDVSLAEQAGNEYQDVTFNIDVITNGISNEPKSGSLLPQTATNTFTLTCIGILLVCFGTLLYVISQRGPRDVRK